MSWRPGSASLWPGHRALPICVPGGHTSWPAVESPSAKGHPSLIFDHHQMCTAREPTEPQKGAQLTSCLLLFLETLSWDGSQGCREGVVMCVGRR